MQRVFILAALMISFGLTSIAHAIILAREGKAMSQIVLADDAIAPEETAAGELANYLQQVTGATFEIVREKDFDDQKPAIFVGPTRRARSVVPQETWETLEHDGVILKTEGDDLILAGGRPRGTLYAVYTFLEDHVGIRWWTDTESMIPSKPTLEIEALATVYVPKLKYRESYHAHVLRDRYQAAARFKLNGHHHGIPEEWGGHYSLIGWCHTSYNLIPPSNYFAAHPEWFSFRDGKRNPEGGQLCWSDPEMQKELARNALQQIRKNSSAGMISISQEDRMGWCECDRCKAIDDANGGAHSASLLTGINAIAEIIAKEYPDFLVETLAYQYTRKAPTQIKPHKNVIVRLCSIECDFAHPLASPQNASFGDDLRDWSKLAENLFIWNYTTNFRNYLIPQPNLNATAADLQFFADNKVIGVFEQADALNFLAGDMLPLRAWLQAKLMWDPSRDQQQLIDEFLAGYFGAAGKPLGEYLKLVNAVSGDADFRRGCYHDQPDFLTDDAIARCNELFDQAEAAVAKDEALLARVRRERLVIEHVNLLRYDFGKAVDAKIKSGVDEQDAQAAVVKEYEARAKAYCDAAGKAGVQNQSEMLGFSAYRPSLIMRHEQVIPVTLPHPGEAPAGAIDLQQDQFYLYQPGALVEIVEDDQASDGQAARMPGNHTAWAVQFHIPENDTRFGKGPWKCYFIVRTKLRASSGGAFCFGVYDARNGFPRAMEWASLRRAGDEAYHAYGLYVESLEAGMYLWVNPPGGEAVESVFVDRIYLKKSP